MGWYLYTGSSPSPVPVGNGEVVAVRPNTKVFVPSEAEGKPEVKRLLASGRLCVTSWPRGAKLPKVEVGLAENVNIGSTDFAESISEGAEIAASASAVVDESSVDGRSSNGGKTTRRRSLKKRASKIKAKETEASLPEKEG